MGLCLIVCDCCQLIWQAANLTFTQKRPLRKPLTNLNKFSKLQKVQNKSRLNIRERGRKTRNMMKKTPLQLFYILTNEHLDRGQTLSVYFFLYWFSFAPQTRKWHSIAQSLVLLFCLVLWCLLSIHWNSWISKSPDTVIQCDKSLFLNHMR